MYGLIAFIGLAAAAPKHSACGAPTTTKIITTSPVSTIVPTICVDYVNSCGKMYGGCFGSTSGSPWPSFTDPGCPTTTYPPVTTTQIITTSPVSTIIPTLCVDYVNSCGKWYGGCFGSTPGSPWPTFTDPGCPTTTNLPPIITTTIPTTAVPTICVDSINACGRTYGGCFASTSPFPTFSDPGCPTLITTTVQTEIPVYPTDVPTICEDFVNSCGRTYGGCYASTSPAPVFTDPGCPTITTVVVTVPTNL